jgi:hypothetical protein
MPKIIEVTTKASEREKVDAYMGRLKHPLARVVEELRRIILSSDKEIGEEIKWNAPTFFYAGKMKATTRRSIDDISWYSIYSTRIASAWYFQVELRSKMRPGCWKATMRTEEDSQCFTTRRT